MKGFTLVELLVVIAIIGVLAGLAMVSFGGAQKQSRDAQRKSDIKQYANALEGYAAKNSGFFPQQLSPVSADTICSSLGLTNCPVDPQKARDPSFDYKYETDGSTNPYALNAGTQYVLWDKLENTSDYWVVCSEGKIGAKSQGSWSNPTGGTCPL